MRQSLRRMKWEYIGFSALCILCLCSFLIAPPQQTIWMMGDSTMAIKADNKRPETGWGEGFAAYLQQDIQIKNIAKNGKSTRSFIKEGLWDQVLQGLQAGDYVIIQFGHNDQKINKDKAGGFLPEYKANLAYFVKEIRSKKATPILLSPIARRSFINGQLQDTHMGYPQAVKKVADSLGVEFIDMTQRSMSLLSGMGEEASKGLFLHLPAGHQNYPKGVEDNTHLNTYGANQIAGLVASAIREQGLSIASLLKEQPLNSDLSYGEKMAKTAMAKLFTDPSFTDTVKGPKWTYDMGVVLEGLLAVWQQTGKGEYYHYVQNWMDRFVTEDGQIRNYKPEEYNIDHIKNGTVLLALYEVTGKQKYLKAAEQLVGQLKTHPRTKEGGFWHKKIYPYQMWLDGLYMAQPFYVRYARIMNKPEIYADVLNQFAYMENHARDAKTGLLYHGWDESRQERWSNPQTGQSPHFWARGMGWFSMALVDVLDYYPEEHTGRQKLIAILQRTMAAVRKVQDPKTGVWYDILDLPNREGNYVEASASSMFVYAMAKGLRKGYLDASYKQALDKAYQGLIKEFVRPAAADRIDLEKVVTVSGLGGKKYRDGSFEYYMSEPVKPNDPKGVGAFLLASAEVEAFHQPAKPVKYMVTLDNYYNNEVKKAADGQLKPYHYLWDGEDNNGFSFLGRLFERHGARLATLRAPGNVNNLKGSSVYIIVDPDTEKEAVHPNYMSAKDAEGISNWVKAGGVLVLLLNDAGNCDLDKINMLSQRFGITFNQDIKNRVKGREFSMGAIAVPAGNPVFPKTQQLYIKELSTMQLQAPATPLITNSDAVIMATARYGKGTVFALGDPWLYNEYVDGRKLPPDFQNFQAANEWVAWLLQQATENKQSINLNKN